MENTKVNREYTNFWKILKEVIVFWVIMYMINQFVYIPGCSWGTEAVNLLAIALCVFGFTRRRNKRRLMIYLIGAIYLYGYLEYGWGCINMIVHLAYLYRLSQINDLTRPDEM